jgi:hypothetical protein
MEYFFSLTAGVIFILWIVAAVAWPLVEEHDRKERAKRFNKNDVKYSDGDNT